MFFNYLKMALRSLFKSRINFVINLLGLSLGLACSILILLFVLDELAFDRFHEDSERIYRLRVDRFSEAGEPEYTSTTSGPMLPAALNAVPQFQSGTRLYRNPGTIAIDDELYFEENLLFADRSFFEVFTFQILAGDAETALAGPDRVVLTESAANRYFGNEDPVGRMLEINQRLTEVTAVVADVPEQSHFSFDLLGSFATFESLFGPSTDWGWWDLSYHAYVKLAPGAEIEQAAGLVRELPRLYIANEEDSSGYRQFLELQPLESIHLQSSYRFELESNSSWQALLILALVGVFVLAIAAINFVNLSTARSAERAREIGLRKVVGAQRRQLIAQFLGESVTLAVAALLLTLVAIWLVLPVFNVLAHKSIELNYLQQWPLTLGLLLGAMALGLAAGLYPALVLSSFRPAMTLKSQSQPGSGNALLRQMLVTLQFGISIALIVGTLVTQRQLAYMLNADMGFERGNTLVLETRSSDVLEEQLEAFRQSLLAIPGVEGVTASGSVPGRNMPTNVASLERGMTETGQTFYFLPVDHDFIDVYGLDIIAGRGFSRDFTTDEATAFIVNEAAYRALGFANPEQALGAELVRQFGDPRDIVGVMRDFNYRSLQYSVEPLVLYIAPGNSFVYVSIRLAESNQAASIDQIRSAWDGFVSDQPFQYFMLEEDFSQQYQLETRIGVLLGLFAVLAILIACLGLYALAVYLTRKRSGEIGIRKVLGASVSRVVLILVYSFCRPVLIAALIAIPICWLLADSWLAGFASRVTLGIDIFIIALLGALAVTIITVAGQTLKAALTNPALSIRSE